jgi:hypothetical protein
VTGVVADSKGYPTTGCAGLKLYCEGLRIENVTNLTIVRVQPKTKAGQQKSAGSTASGGSTLLAGAMF